MNELVRLGIEIAIFVILGFTFSAIGFFLSPMIGNALIGMLAVIAFLRGSGLLKFSKKKD